jgi:hypothetical protein
MAGDMLARHAWSTSPPERSEVTRCRCSSEARPPMTRSSVRTVANECPTEPTSARCVDTTYVPVTAFRVQQWSSRTTSGDAGLAPWRCTRLGRTACRGVHFIVRAPRRGEAMASHVTNPPNLAHAIVTAVRSLPRRLRGHWRATELDRALAAGVDPETTPEIAAHAESLCSRRKREALAGAIYLALKDASLGTSPLSVRVPIARDAIRRNRPELLALAAELRQATDVSPRGSGSQVARHQRNRPSTAMTRPTPWMPRSSR